MLDGASRFTAGGAFFCVVLLNSGVISRGGSLSTIAGLPILRPDGALQLSLF
jgi:hypothetical protein